MTVMMWNRVIVGAGPQLDRSIAAAQVERAGADADLAVADPGFVHLVGLGAGEAVGVEQDLESGRCRLKSTTAEAPGARSVPVSVASDDRRRSAVVLGDPSHDRGADGDHRDHRRRCEPRRQRTSDRAPSAPTRSARARPRSRRRLRPRARRVGSSHTSGWDERAGDRR